MSKKKKKKKNSGHGVLWDSYRIGVNLLIHAVHHEARTGMKVNMTVQDVNHNNNCYVC